jgi:hypothetical protein
MNIKDRGNLNVAAVDSEPAMMNIHMHACCLFASLLHLLTYPAFMLNESALMTYYKKFRSIDMQLT